MPGGRPTHYPGDLRQALLAAAEEEIARDGIGQLSLRGVARRLGVSHNAPAHHFPDRAALLTALATHGARLLGRALETAASTTPDPVERLAALGRAYIAFAGDHPALFDAMLRPDLVHTDDHDLMTAEAHTYAVLTGTVTAAARAGWGAGLDPDILAVLAWSTVHGLATLTRQGQLTDRRPHDLAEHVTTALTHLGRQRPAPEPAARPPEGRDADPASSAAVAPTTAHPPG